VIPLVIGAWMFNASHQSGKYAWMEMPGALLALAGMFGTAIGILWFALSRLFS
jgi:hypothetical protein